MIFDSMKGQYNTIELKIITTRVYSRNKRQGEEADDVLFTKGSLIFPCGGQTALEVGNHENIIQLLAAIIIIDALIVFQVLEVQLPGKKVVNASAFWNGLRGQKLKRI